jgi:hypothetical protein
MHHPRQKGASLKLGDHGMLRDLLAVLIIAVACPLALAVGSTIGCVGQAFSSSCAISAVVISPVILFLAGVAAGLATRGWTGWMLVLVGLAIGMTAILVLTFGIGKPVPLDPVSGFIAWVWFVAPISAGYGLTRVARRAHGARRGSGTRR